MDCVLRIERFVSGIIAIQLIKRRLLVLASLCLDLKDNGVLK